LGMKIHTISHSEGAEGGSKGGGGFFME